MVDFLIKPEVVTELVNMPIRHWNLINKLIEETYADNAEEVPLLLRGVFAALPEPHAWFTLRDRLVIARQRAMGERMVARRREYMRNYMLKKRVKKEEATA
jgi:hypothetical protein